MDTFGLAQLGMLLAFILILAVVSALGPSIWRARHALIGRYFERRTVYDLVRTLQQELDEARANYVAQEPQTATDGDGRTDGRRVSEADQWLERLKVDRTRAATIELMVYSGWKVEQIRSVVKGENSAISVDVEAARQRLGIAEAPRVIPVSERGSDPRPLVLERRWHDDPELEFKPPNA